MSARRLLGSCLAALAGCASLALLAPAASAAAGPQERVVVRELPGAGDGPEHAVEALGGTVGRQLGIIGGFSATVPAGAVAALRGAPGVREVTPDARVTLASTTDYDPTSDTGSMLNTGDLLGVQAMYDAGITGKGIDVALIDSGVTKVAGLDASGKVLDGPDLSFDSQDRTKTRVDGYGHGTHMAGIIAGWDGTPLTEDGRTTGFTGIAPGARILNMKVADATGAADVSQVIAAIDWVAQNGRKNGLNVKVLNLSFGTQSQQAYTLDPLAFAAEQAWKRGIVVVVSAGNDGDGTGQLDNPAYDPYVIAVGADDTRGTKTKTDDVIPDWSSKGDGTRNPDVVSPGWSIQSLRSPGSFLDTTFPDARRGDRFFKGSGTSQAAAVVSGVAALLLQQNGGYGPDQVKAALRGTATRLPATDQVAQGKGLVDLSKPSALRSYGSASPQTWQPSTGTGTLEAARGGDHLISGGKVLQGERDVFGKAWNGSSWAQASANGTSWSGGTWNGSSWAGTSWAGSSWAGCSWAGSSWAGTSWAGSSWAGASWAGASWAGSSWAGTSWAGSSWA